MLLSAKTIADNLQEMAKQGDELSQPELARRMGIGSKTFWTMKEGNGNPQLENIEKAARYLKRPIWQLLIPNGHKLARDFDPFKGPQPALEAGHVRIAVLEAFPSAGTGGEPVDWPAVLDHIDIAEGWAKKHLGNRIEQVRALPVMGDSMSPTINEGDLAFVDTACTRYETDGIYVIVWNERLFIKRLVADFGADRLEVRSDNPMNPTWHITASQIDSLRVCGRVKAWLAIKGY
jgi:transcriptional regulator with XRE-family HTH domain